MKVRAVEAADCAAWAAMRHRLWPDADFGELARESREALSADPSLVAFVAEDGGGELVAFIELTVRSYAEGAPAGGAPYVEGLWVDPSSRRQGMARALLAKAEEWARASNHSYLGSDALLDNEASHAWHRSAGFNEVERIVVFGKSIR